MARYGEDQAHSFQPRLYPNGFRYRDWLVRAFNRDMPYDRFILEQIAGDLLDGPDRLDRLAALGFFACGPVYYGDAKKHDQYADRIDTLTRGFLGLTVACARCHDHKYDPIPTTDYYALDGCLRQHRVRRSARRAQGTGRGLRQGPGRDPGQGQGNHGVPQGGSRAIETEGGENQLKQFERMLPAEAKAKVKALRAELDRLKKNAPPKYPVIHTLGEASRPTDMPVLIRGNADTPGAKVPRRFLTVLGGDRSPFQHGSGRLELARAIASPDNPLTARVMVNRIWQHHFGRGLVATSSNFGTLGERPSHPELLDWLAHRFVASGWSLKALHREIMLSAAYQQSSRFDSQGFAKDPGNALLWRMNRRRLDVEAWRDAMLAVAGRLDATIGGPSVSLDAPANRSPHPLRRDQPARPGLDAPPLRLPRPQYHQRRSRRDDRPAAAALRSQQRVHGRECPGRRRAAAGRRAARPGRRRPHPPGLPPALRPRRDRARAQARPGVSPVA